MLLPLSRFPGEGAVRVVSANGANAFAAKATEKASAP